MTTFQTARTRIRPLQVTDFEGMRRLESDADVMKFTPMRVPQSPLQTENRLQAQVARLESLRPFGLWVAEEKETRGFIGWFMLLKTEFNLPELGFMLVRDYWSKGYATEIATALRDYAVNELQCPGLTAVTDSGNEASMRVLAKLGFRFKNHLAKEDKVQSSSVVLNVFEYDSTHRADDRL